jgi:hypothetical protein
MGNYKKTMAWRIVAIVPIVPAVAKMTFIALATGILSRWRDGIPGSFPGRRRALSFCDTALTEGFPGSFLTPPLPARG